MARGNTIIVTANPKGTFAEGTITEAIKPGCFVQVKAATAFTNGRPSLVAAAPGTDGKQIVKNVLLESDEGLDINTAYVIGTRARYYTPVQGEEMNLRAGEVAGTGNSYAIGDRLIVDAEDGIVVPDAGSPQEIVAIAMEAVTSVVGSTLLFCQMA